MLPLRTASGSPGYRVNLRTWLLKYLRSEAYESLQKKVTAKRKEYDDYIERAIKVLDKALADQGIEGEVTGRTKHLYSVFNKMKAQELPFEEIYDLIAFRIIVESVKDCYGVLGIIHSMFKPIPGRFKDYIGVPKVKPVSIPSHDGLSVLSANRWRFR